MKKKKNNFEKIKRHRIKIKIKTGDTVIVIAGKDKGKKGKVQKVDYKKRRVLVEGVNFVKKHKRPTQNDSKGNIVETNVPIHISNVMYFSTKLNKGVRLGYKFIEEDKKKKKIRIGRHKGQEIEL